MGQKYKEIFENYFNKKYTFETFVIGDNNRLGYAFTAQQKDIVCTLKELVLFQIIGKYFL